MFITKHVITLHEKKPSAKTPIRLLSSLPWLIYLEYHSHLTFKIGVIALFSWQQTKAIGILLGKKNCVQNTSDIEQDDGIQAGIRCRSFEIQLSHASHICYTCCLIIAIRLDVLESQGRFCNHWLNPPRG